MNNYTRYFKGIENLQALKKMYHALAKKYHPDIAKTDTNKIMAEINKEYTLLFEQLKKANNENANANVKGFKFTEETPNDFMNIINKLIHLNDIKIEICGLWLWISGNTFKHKELLSDLGLKYSKNKKAWYFSGTKKVKHYRGSWSMQEIRNTYGSIIYQQEKKLALEF